jgi:nitroimidazol reductase NimA-like FMN-containing flavoprotein (pyridoxamine 5'-phosphate oxidase superfamily)
MRIKQTTCFLTHSIRRFYQCSPLGDISERTTIYILGGIVVRRNDREKDAAFALEVLRDCEYATLATVNLDGTPYCIPISPALIGNAVYFHCAAEGQKLTNINQNNTVCISCVRRIKLIPEKFTTEYESSVAAGKCRIISDKSEKIAALRAICEKYAKTNMKHFDEQITEFLDITCICRIDIEQITGKANTAE